MLQVGSPCTNLNFSKTATCRVSIGHLLHSRKLFPLCPELFALHMLCSHTSYIQYLYIIQLYRHHIRTRGVGDGLGLGVGLPEEK